MNVGIDRQVCIGCEQCVDTCPEVFTMEGKKALVKSNPITRDWESMCLEAMDSCPVNAIAIQDPHAFMLLSSGELTPHWLAL